MMCLLVLVQTSLWPIIENQAGAHSPRLHFDKSVDADLRLLALDLWQDFMSVFSGRSDCFGDVVLNADTDLDSRAAYDPGTAVVTVRVPGTPAMLQSALLHEWAHHIEHQCAEHAELRPMFLTAQGMHPDTPWGAGDRWDEIPSEQYAEATIELILGPRPVPTGVRVSKEGIQTIRMWAQRKH